MEVVDFRHVTDEAPGVDFDFCKRARLAGFSVWFDVRRRCLHNTIVPL